MNTEVETRSFSNDGCYVGSIAVMRQLPRRDSLGGGVRESPSEGEC